MHHRVKLNCSEKWLSIFFGGHKGRVLRILILFLCALGVLVGIYRARGARLEKELKTNNVQLLNGNLRHPSIHSQSSNLQASINSLHLQSVSTTKWVIVASLTEEENESNKTMLDYACSLIKVAKDSGWKTILINYQPGKVQCCSLPQGCYSIHPSQFLRMSYKSAGVLKKLIESDPQTYKESIRNLAYIWVIHRGARFIFDSYLEEYQGTPLETFSQEMTRQLHALALDDSLALVEDRSINRIQNHKTNYRNPYSHFGRPDLNLNLQQLDSNNKNEFPMFRICEVRPPSIEKFLETDSNWWDKSAPPLVLPGDTMPPLCTRNTLFSPDVFWALPLLGNHHSAPSKIPPPWYLRGLWSQSLLGDLGGSIRLSLNLIPTIGLFTENKTEMQTQPQLSKHYHCRSRSTYRCLNLISKELKIPQPDQSLIESWITDLKSIHYAEPPMLPRRRSHSNPCLGADGLHGVSFFPQTKPLDNLDTSRNETIKNLLQKYAHKKSKRSVETKLLPPLLNATYYQTNWTEYNSTDDYSQKTNQNSTDNSYFPTNQKTNLQKTMSELICPGISNLIPTTKNINSNKLLIIVFKNHNYDLLPTLEVIYRSNYPNILYCGHPHVSIDLFMKKYQSVESRSFSYLPTYTKSTYECLLGAMEMNYDLVGGGYLVITDDLLVKSWNLPGENELDKIWIGQSNENVVDKNQWKNLDPKGMKLPKLLDGVINSFKLFLNIIQGHHFVNKRSLDSNSNQDEQNGSYADINRYADSDFNQDQNQGQDDQNQNDPIENSNQGQYQINPTDPEEILHYSIPDPTYHQLQSENKTVNYMTQSESQPEEIELGSEDEIIEEESINNDTNINDNLNLNSTLNLTNDSDFNTTNTKNSSIESTTESVMTESTPTDLDLMPTTEDPNSVGVPLYHVEHGGTEQPTPPTWHKPDELTTSKPEFIQAETKYFTTSTNLPEIDTENLELNKEMDLLIDSLGSVFESIREIITEKGFAFVNSTTPDQTHRISPREFRHIRCNPPDDLTHHGHHSDPLCSILQNFLINLLTPTATELTHSTPNVYYIPQTYSKPFYSVANVLLHFNVLDELALPLLFKGLSNNLILLNKGNLNDENSYIQPFNFHKIYQDQDKQMEFCKLFISYVLS